MINTSIGISEELGVKVPYLNKFLAKYKPDILVLFKPLVDEGEINNKIWIFWNSNINIQEFQWEQQHVSCRNNVGGSKQIWYTFVYAKCRWADRINIWDSLISMADLVHIPWLVGGVFNTIAHPDVKFGKHKVDEKAIIDFNKFTWTNNRHGDDNSP